MPDDTLPKRPKAPKLDRPSRAAKSADSGYLGRHEEPAKSADPDRTEGPLFALPPIDTHLLRTLLEMSTTGQPPPRADGDADHPDHPEPEPAPAPAPTEPVELMEALVQAFLFRLGFAPRDMVLVRHVAQVLEAILKVRQQRHAEAHPHADLLRLVNSRSTATAEGAVQLALQLGATEEKVDACVHAYVMERVAVDARLTSALLALTIKP